MNIHVESFPPNVRRQIGRASQDDDEHQEERDGDPYRDAVQFGDGGDVESVAAGRLVAGVRTGAGDDGAGDQRRRHEDGERHEQPGDERCHTDVLPTPHRFGTRAVHGDETEADGQHRQDEM